MRLLLLTTSISSLVFSASLLVSEGEDQAGGEEPSRLSHTAQSADELGRLFLRRLAEGRREALEGLGMTQQEFETHVWHRLPAGRPHTNLTREFVWESLAIRSQSSLESTWRTYKGEKFEFAGIRFAGGSTDYGEYRIHRDARLQVVDKNGQRRELNLFGSIIEKDGRFKIFSFVR